jgi:transcriptional regulator with XRE-family HTH domain
MDHRVSINVRFILWTRKVARQRWETWLASQSGIPEDVCKKLVRGTAPDADLSNSHLRALADSLGLDVETLRHSNLLRDRRHVTAENLRFLFRSLGHGGKKSIAATLRIAPTTVSRWLNGTYEPQPASLRQLVSEFGLPADTNLQEDPIFLSIEPISVPIELGQKARK